MSILVSRFGFLNFDQSGWGVQIRNQRLRKLPNAESHLNQITSNDEICVKNKLRSRQIFVCILLMKLIRNSYFK